MNTKTNDQLETIEEYLDACDRVYEISNALEKTPEYVTDLERREYNRLLFLIEGYEVRNDFWTDKQNNLSTDEKISTN
jgi:hypothetical protein